MAVDLLKRAMLDQVGPAMYWQFYGSLDGPTLSPDAALDAAIWRYVPTGAVVDFRGGANRPDIVIKRDENVRLVCEIKGRKDLSNLWESWMPQLVDHLRTWAIDYPTALRGVFMTLINEEMIAGASRTGGDVQGCVLSMRQTGCISQSIYRDSM